MSSLYISFWLDCVLILLFFIILKFVFRFFKINGSKNIFSLFIKKENRSFALGILVFTLFFWLSFYFIYYSRIYPKLLIEEHIKEYNTSYNNGCYFGQKCSKFVKLNTEYSNDLTMEITTYHRNHFVFKLNRTVILKECETCNSKVLKAKQEYKLAPDKPLYLAYENDDNVYYKLLIT